MNDHRDGKAGKAEQEEGRQETHRSAISNQLSAISNRQII
jgi:hypothetical protein